jgi:hypothetical protein
VQACTHEVCRAVHHFASLLLHFRQLIFQLPGLFLYQTIALRRQSPLLDIMGYRVCSMVWGNDDQPSKSVQQLCFPTVLWAFVSLTASRDRVYSCQDSLVVTKATAWILTCQLCSGPSHWGICHITMTLSLLLTEQLCVCVCVCVCVWYWDLNSGPMPLSHFLCVYEGFFSR